MITLEILYARCPELQPDDLRRWILQGYVRAEIPDGRIAFEEIDVERVRLILDLRNRLQVNEEALPVVLSLLDQLYEMRRRFHFTGT